MLTSARTGCRTKNSALVFATLLFSAFLATPGSAEDVSVIRAAVVLPEAFQMRVAPESQTGSLRSGRSETLNLFAAAKPRSVKKVTVPVLGRGAYICSPAGSGSKSRCYQR